MNINRVLLVSDNNSLYYDFWNNISYTYSEKFGITPTLIFFGTFSEFKKTNLSDKYGEIKLENPIHNIEKWQYTWALFYFTKLYSNDISIIMGIDQIPLGTFFLKDLINEIDNDKYIMLIDDQYTLERKCLQKWDEGGYSPSAYHIAKGKTYEEIYEFEKTFEKEILKINSLELKTMWDNKWGYDEAYSCKKLRDYKDRGRIIDMSKSDFFLSKRIDCHRNFEVSYDLNMLINNEYIECHSCRPYSNHKEYLDKLFNSIPKYI
jgi:hypothetical protein